MMLLIIASSTWALGSFVSRRLRLPKDALVSTSYQLLLGGLMLLAVGSVVGEWSQVRLDDFTPGSVWALLYLITFGSLLAYSAYTWLLQNAPIARVATYAYVNPVVAVALGWIVLGEWIDPLMLVGAAMIVTSVAFIVAIESRPAAVEVAVPTPRARRSRMHAGLEAPAKPIGDGTSSQLHGDSAAGRVQRP
jgi:drug/metabolite transporter (DMT)-like permease